MYSRHTLVVTVNKMWSTIEHSSPLNLLELLNEYSVKLIYLGQQRFGELKPKSKPPSRPMPSLLVPPSASPSTSKLAATEECLTVQTNVQTISSKPNERDACTTNASATVSRATTTPETEQTPSLPVETNPLHVETAHGIPSVESRSNSIVNVETEKGHVHVETQGNDQATSHVETDTDIPVVSHVHVDTEQVEPSKTQANVHTKSDHLPVQLPRTAKLVLKPLSDLEIDVWCSKTMEYHRFVPSVENSENSNHTGYSLQDRKPKGTSRENKTISVSLRKTNSVDYAPMLDGASEDSDALKRNTSNKIRPKVDGPSTAMMRAHAQIQNNRQKNFKTKPVPVLPV